MLTLKTLTLSAALIAGLAGPASAHEAWCKTDYVPGHYETRMEQVETPGRWVDEEKVVETPGRYETRYDTVEVPGRWETVERRVWVEGHWEDACGPTAEVKIGRIGIGVGLPARRWVPGYYETRCERVWIAPTCERREVQVWVPGCRRVEVVRVWRPGCTVERPVQVWVPARYDTVCRPAPAPRRHGGADRVIVVPAGGNHNHKRRK